MATNRQILLRRRPVGRPTADDFELVSTAVPQPAEGEVLRRTIFLSLDPYMRGRMSDEPSYAASVELGRPMVGHTVSRVVESRHPAIRAGDVVAGYDGWQDYGVGNGSSLRVLDPTIAPMTTALGVLGMPGITAYVGLLDIGQPKPGETVVVSAASGAVGSVVAQIARIKGCRVVGIAGGAQKCAYVVNELGCDACVDHKSGSFADDLQSACPSGIDVYFENVGGDVFAAVLKLLNVGARIPLCGLIADYNTPASDAQPGAEPRRARPSLRPLLTKRVLLKGFIVSDHTDRNPAALRDLSQWLREGALKYREDIVDGLEHTPAAFLKLFDGTNFGKLIVRVSSEPESGGTSALT
ncbi:MAG TPA: NADP-dependent oxidoreductase [Vicinamibacterales bacterium]|nr:NADP-dependent oxidoreductase [Vicinamibacterales bacterium]